MLKIRNIFKRKPKEQRPQFGFKQFPILNHSPAMEWKQSDDIFGNFALIIPTRVMKIPTPEKTNKGMVSFISKEKWHKRIGCFFGFHKWRTYMMELDRNGFDIHHNRCRKCLGSKLVKNESK